MQDAAGCSAGRVGGGGGRWAPPSVARERLRGSVMGWRSGARWHEQKLIMVLRTALVSTVATAALQLVAAPQLEVVQRRARLAAASPAHASPLPLPSQLLMLHEIEASTYVAKPARAVHRRAQESTAATTETLTATNTAPIQLQLDTSQLYENSSEPYTTCHRIGAWFRWNFPRSLGPPCEAAQLPTQAANQDDVRTWAGFARTQRALFDGEGDAQANIPCGEADGRVSAFHPELNPTGEICNRNYSPDAQNCWGVCLVEDVVEGDEMRSFMVAKMNEAIEEISRYFRVRARSAPLRLRQSAGQYLGLYTSVPGLTTASECAKDAKRIWRLPIRPELCTTGFDADAIVFLSLPQYIPRVSGWGATALQDDIGRPVVLAVGWSVPSSGGISTLVGSARQRREQINTRAVLIHEMIHALGFNTLSFIQAGIITQGSATDADGSIDPTVWFAIGPRTLTTASHYFNCTGLERLPLMAENQLGESARGSHWETRILNDEIMAYGEGKMVSEITLAMMEDLGHYLANYSQAGCMHWGRQQGCDFVRTRCAVRRDELSMPAIAADGFTAIRCAREYPKTFGGTVSGGSSIYPGNPVLMRKCARPNCAASMPRQGRCNAECVQVASDPAVNEEIARRFECGSTNLGDFVVTTRFVTQTRSLYSSYTGMFLLVTGCFFLLVLVVFCGLVRAHHYPHLQFVFKFINAFTCVLGLALIGFAVWAFVLTGFYKDWYGDQTIKLGFGASCVVTGWGIAGCGAIWAVRRKCFAPLILYTLVLLGTMCMQAVCSIILMVWVVDSFDVEQGMYNSIGLGGNTVNTGEEWIDSKIESSLIELEAIMCAMYRHCCWVTQRGANSTATCMQGHGMVTAAVALQDPSRQDFCELVTGVRSQLTGSLPSCAPFEDAGIIDMHECGTSFCNTNVKGFEKFVARAFDYVRSNVVIFAILSGLFGVGETVLFCTSVTLLLLHALDKVHTDHLPPHVINSSAWTHGAHLTVDPRKDFQSALVSLQEQVVPDRHENKTDLLDWCAGCLRTDYPQLQVTNFTSSWEDGRVLCALICVHRPALLDWEAVRQPVGNAAPRVSGATGDKIEQQDKIRNVRLANAILQQDFGLSVQQCVPASQMVEGCWEDSVAEFLSLLKLLLTSKACKHARMLETRDAAVVAQRRNQKRQWKKIQLAVVSSRKFATSDAPDPRHRFADALRVLDPDLHAPKQGLPNRASDILRWCQESTAGFPELEGAAWRTSSLLSSTWLDGVGLCALVHAYRPVLINWADVRIPTVGEGRSRMRRLSKEDSQHNLELVVQAGRGRLEIPDSRNLRAADLLASQFDQRQKQEVLQYMSLLKRLLTSHASRHAAQLEADEEGAPQPRADAMIEQRAPPVANGESDPIALRARP